MMILWVEETAKRRGTFHGWIEGFGQIVSASPTPFFTAARVLLQRGVDPETVLQMRRKDETDSLRAKVGVASELTVFQDTDGPPRFRLFQPWSDQETDRTKKRIPEPTLQPPTGPQWLPDGQLPSSHIAGVTGPAPA
jgi:hypothetical protein